MAYGSYKDPNDIRWNDAGFYLQRLDAIENNITAIMKEYNPENLKMFLSLLDAYMIATYSVVKYDKAQYEQIINEVELKFFRLDINKDGKVDEYEAMRNNSIVINSMKTLREVYIDIKSVVTPYLSIDIKKQLKEMKKMAMYRAIDKWVDKHILNGDIVYCLSCKQPFRAYCKDCLERHEGKKNGISTEESSYETAQDQGVCESAQGYTKQQ